MFAGIASRHGATLLASIEAASVSLGIVEHRSKAPVHRLHLSAALPIQERTKAQNAAGLKNLLQEKIPELLKLYAGAQGHMAIKSVYAVVHTPVSISQVISSRRAFEKEEKITDALLDECARVALGDMPKRPDFLGARLLQTRLNGYATARPQGKYAQEVEIIGLSTTIDQNFREPVFSAFHSATPGIEVQFRSGVLAISSIDAARVAADAVVIYLSMEGAELVVVRGGVPTTCAYVPVGIRVIAGGAARGAPPETILSTMRIAQAGKGSDVALQETEVSLASVEPEIVKVFGESLAALSSPLRLPVRALLISPPEMVDWFGRFMTRIDFAPFTQTAQPFAVQPVSFPILGDAKKENDVGLSLTTALFKSELAA